MKIIDHGQLGLLDHSFELGVHEFGGQTKSFGSANSQVARSVNNYWIRTSLLYRVSGFQRLGGISLEYRICEGLRAEVSGEHVARPSSEDDVVDKWTLVS
jgi:hypothetical protein